MEQTANMKEEEMVKKVEDFKELAEQIQNITLSQEDTSRILTIKTDCESVAETAESEKPDPDGGDKSDGTEEEEEEGHECEPDITPLIQLPPLVTVEENKDENVIVECRAKLYSFSKSQSQWLERGVGTIALLQSKKDLDNCRVVMWRKEVGTVACNFRLYHGIVIDYLQNKKNVLCWKCQDFSEMDEPEWMTFSCRFGSEEQCANFKNQAAFYANKIPQQAAEPDDETLIAEDDSSSNDSSYCSCCSSTDINSPVRVDGARKDEVSGETLIECSLDTNPSTESPQKITLESYIPTLDT